MKTELMKRRSGAWLGQYILVSVIAIRSFKDNVRQTRRGSSWRTDCEYCPSYRKFSVDHSIMKTSSTIKSFFLAVTLHPEVVLLAQRELDEVLAGERLPDFSDKPRLPYISAIMKEVLRWRPPTPIGTLLLQRSVTCELG